MTFRSNRKGNVVGLIIMICTILIVAILYITTMPAIGLLWNTIYPDGIPTYAAGTMNLLNNVCGWTLLILVIGTLGYGAALASRRDPVDIPG